MDHPASSKWQSFTQIQRKVSFCPPCVQLSVRFRYCKQQIQYDRLHAKINSENFSVSSPTCSDREVEERGQLSSRSSGCQPFSSSYALIDFISRLNLHLAVLSNFSHNGTRCSITRENGCNPPLRLKAAFRKWISGKNHFSAVGILHYRSRSCRLRTEAKTRELNAVIFWGSGRGERRRRNRDVMNTGTSDQIVVFVNHRKFAAAWRVRQMSAPRRAAGSEA